MTKVRTGSAQLADQAGFTLVELLVALVLLSVITTAILGGIDFSHRVWKTSPERELRAEIEAAGETLGALLAETIPAVGPGDDGMAQLVFQGGQHDLVAVTLSEGRSQIGGMSLTRLSRETGGATNVDQIRISSTVFRAGTAFAPLPPDAATSVLFHDVVSLDLSYFGVVTSGKPPEWQDQWIGRDHLPELVRIRIILRAAPEPISLSIPVRIPAAQ
jgi:general secretion pathway protein J